MYSLPLSTPTPRVAGTMGLWALGALGQAHSTQAQGARGAAGGAPPGRGPGLAGGAAPWCAGGWWGDVVELCVGRLGAVGGAEGELGEGCGHACAPVPLCAACCLLLPAACCRDLGSSLLCCAMLSRAAIHAVWLPGMGLPAQQTMPGTLWGHSPARPLFTHLHNTFSVHVCRLRATTPQPHSCVGSAARPPPPHTPHTPTHLAPCTWEVQWE